MVVILNRGVRTWDLKDGKDASGKPVKRRLPPGGSIDALDEAEASQLLAHTRELVDAEKALPQVSDKIKLLTEQVADLTAKLADATERLKKYEPESEGKGKGKGKDK